MDESELLKMLAEQTRLSNEMIEANKRLMEQNKTLMAEINQMKGTGAIKKQPIKMGTKPKYDVLHAQNYMKGLLTIRAMYEDGQIPNQPYIVTKEDLVIPRPLTLAETIETYSRIKSNYADMLTSNISDNYWQKIFCEKIGTCSTIIRKNDSIVKIAKLDEYLIANAREPCPTQLGLSFEKSGGTLVDIAKQQKSGRGSNDVIFEAAAGKISLWQKLEELGNTDINIEFARGSDANVLKPYTITYDNDQGWNIEEMEYLNTPLAFLVVR